MTRNAILAGGFVVGVFHAFVGRAFAQDIYWNGGTADWNTAAKWGGGAVPGAGSYADVNDGTVIISGNNGSAYSVNVGDLHAGDTSGLTGSYVQTGGTAAVSGWVRLGVNGGTGNYTISGGSISAGRIDLGEFGSGNMTVSGTAAVSVTSGTQNWAAGDLFVGGANGGGSGTGNLTINGGSVTIAGDPGYNRSLVVGGQSSVSIVTITGGTLTALAGDVLLGGSYRNDSESSAIVNQSGGTVSFHPNGNSGVTRIGNNSSATYNLSGGTLTEHNEIIVGDGPGDGTLVLSGTGVLATNAITRGVSTGTFYFNGGTLKVNGSALPANATAFIAGLTAANVQDGGANIDTNGFDATISQALLNYGSGGLTKNGAGTLTLSGTNTYGGPTNVTAGTIKLSTAGNNNISNSSTIEVAPGTTLDVSAVSGAGGFTLNGSSAQKLEGGGTVVGSVTVSSGSNLVPGESVGTLTLSALSLAPGSILDYEFNSTPANDFTNVTSANGLSINGGGFNLYIEGTANPFSTPGTYHLVNYVGALQGSGISALSVLNPQQGVGYTFSNNTSLNDIDLRIALQPRWQVDANGNWSVSSHWSNGIPNSVGDTANFLGAISAARTVTIDTPQTVGHLVFNSAQRYTLAGSKTLTIDGGGAATIEVDQATHTISAPLAIAAGNVVTYVDPGTLNITGAQSHGANSALTINSGTVNISTDVGAAGAEHLTLNANSAVNLTGMQHLAALNIGPGTLVTMTRSTNAPQQVLVAGALSLASTGDLDLKDNSMIVHGGADPMGTFLAVEASIRSAFNNYNLNGHGIKSSTIADPTATGLGSILNNLFFSPLGTFNGQSVNGSDTIVKYTYMGDATIDGVVNDDDASLIGGFYDNGATSGHHWFEGDFTHDGVINDDDVSVIFGNYDPNESPLSARLLRAKYGANFAAAAERALAAPAVPEPCTLVLAGLGLLGVVLLARRRRLRG